MVFAIPKELDAWVVKAGLRDATHDRFVSGVSGNELKTTIAELRELNLVMRRSECAGRRNPEHGIAQFLGMAP